MKWFSAAFFRIYYYASKVIKGIFATAIVVTILAIGSSFTYYIEFYENGQRKAQGLLDIRKGHSVAMSGYDVNGKSININGGYFLDAYRVGTYKEWYKSGQLMSVTKTYYRFDKPYFSKSWYENGQVRRVAKMRLLDRSPYFMKAWYANGAIATQYHEHDIVQTWHTNGQPAYAYCDNDKICRAWYASGQLAFARSFDSEKKLPVLMYYYKSGQPLAKYSAIGDKQYIYETWHENGKLASRAQYSLNGTYIEFNGMYRVWYADGMRAFEGAFLQGYPTGRHRAWYPNGQLLFDVTYKTYNDEYGGIFQYRVAKHARWWNRNGVAMNISPLKKKKSDYAIETPQHKYLITKFPEMTALFSALSPYDASSQERESLQSRFMRQVSLRKLIGGDYDVQHHRSVSPWIMDNIIVPADAKFNGYF